MAPPAPRIMPTMPVRPTSTSPSSRISATKLSILSGAPVSSNTKLSVVVSTTLARNTSASAQRLDPVLAGARDLDQRQLALDVRAGLGQVDDLVHRHQPLELRADLVDHRGRAVGDDGDPADRVVRR